MTTAVMGIEKLLRPAWNFELDYDGVSGATPLLFTWPPAANRPALGVADYSVLNDEARQTTPPVGVSPTLAKFVPIPFGSTMIVQFPFVPSVRPVPTEEWAYVWKIVWRTRSAADYVGTRKRRAYQIGKTKFGAVDSRTSAVPDARGITSVGGDRYVIPGASEAAIYGRGEPNINDVTSGPVTSGLLQDAVAIPTSLNMQTQSPLYPGQVNFAGPGFVREMDYQQGIFDPDFPNISNVEDPDAFNTVTTSHYSKWIKSQGTEFAVECYKFEYARPTDLQTYTPRDWNFDIGGEEPNLPASGSEDYPFSVMFGIGSLLSTVARQPPIDTGVRVMFGSSPK
jgi:hypothetical protein